MPPFDDVPDDEIDIEPRSAREIGLRIVVLASVVRRATLELQMLEGTLDQRYEEDEDDEEERRDDPHGEWFDLKTMIASEPLAEIATDEERAFISSQLESAGEQSALDQSWVIESLNALEWACTMRGDLPGPWLQTDPEAALDPVPQPGDDLETFLVSLQVRSDEELAAGREQAELWTWRAEMEREISASSPRQRKELRAMIAETASEAEYAGLLARSGTDFSTGRGPFSAAGEETKDTIAVIATRRLHALNWVCGFGETWDSVPLEV